MPAVTFAVANQKGGVGKTTLLTNIAGVLAYKKHRVLVIDADPQCNATLFFTDPEEILPPSRTIAAIYGEKTENSADIILPTRFPTLNIVPGGFTLAGNVADIAQRFDAGRRLQGFLRDKKDLYDFIFIDCPPDIGIYTLNAFVASDYVIVPIQPERLALEGFSQLSEKIEMIQSFGEQLRLFGVITTMLDERTSSQRDWYSQITATFSEIHLGIFHRATLIAEATDAGKLVVDVDRKGRPYQELVRICTEICRRLDKKLERGGKKK